jgi:CheY-like chemotaxis protein
MARRKIVVIDDEKDIQAMLRAIFQAAGDQVLSAVDGVQGLMLARQAGVDAIVLDINMPGGGGYTVFERLSTMTATMAIPVLVYTAVAIEQVQERITFSPTTAFLAKPAPPEAIQQALNALLGTA